MSRSGSIPPRGTSTLPTSRSAGTSPEWSPGPHVAGDDGVAAAAATSQEDNTRSQLGFLNEGFRNEFAMALGAGATPTPEPWIIDNQAPKAILFPLGTLPPRPWIEQTLPLQLIRIGDLVLAAVPAEATIVADCASGASSPTHWAYRCTTSCWGYSNGYSQYVTTPEEYVSQQYGAARRCSDAGRSAPPAGVPRHGLRDGARATVDRSSAGRQLGDAARSVGRPARRYPDPGKRFGDVVSAPAGRARGGDTVRVVFCGAFPTNRIRRGPQHQGCFAVEKRTATGWTTAFNDDHESTELHWARPAGNDSRIADDDRLAHPRGTAGTYRIRYYGDAKAPSGALREFTGTTGPITVG